MKLKWSQLCCLVIIFAIFVVVSSFFLGNNDNHTIDNFTIPNDAVIVSCSNISNAVDNTNYTVYLHYYGEDTSVVVGSYDTDNHHVSQVKPGPTKKYEYYEVSFTFNLEDMRINGSNNYPESPDFAINNLFTNNTYEFNESSSDLGNIEDLILIFYDNNGSVINTINLTESNVTFSINETIDGSEYYNIRIVSKSYEGQEITGSYVDVENRDNEYNVGDAELHILLHNGTNYYYDLIFPLKINVLFGRILEP